MRRRRKVDPQHWAAALAAVGESEDRQLDWLMDFIARTVPPANRDVLEVEAFCLRHAGFAVGRARYQPAADFSIGLTLADVDTARTTLRTNFQVLGSATPAEGVAVFVTPSQQLLTWDENGDLVLTMHGGRVPQFFAYVVRLLLSVGRGRLRVCRAPKKKGSPYTLPRYPATCGRFFVATRPHQAYCSPSCTNRAGAARYRARNPSKVSDRRHRRYAREVEGRVGQNVKIARRARKT